MNEKAWVGVYNLPRNMIMRPGINIGDGARPSCPHTSGSPAAVIWHKLQVLKDHAAYCERQIKEYQSQLDADKALVFAHENVLAKITGEAT